MNKQDISIVVVDDAKFSSTLIQRTLEEANYTDIRIANSAQEAMNLIQARPASILMADWIMPEIDGLELTRQVKEINLKNGFFTYVMLLTAKEGVQAIETAFNEGVDDFISKSDLKAQLIPRTLAATRVSVMQNASLKKQKQLEQYIVQIQRNGMIDPVTQRGNLKYFIDRTNKTYQQVTQRNGEFYIFVAQIDSLKQTHAQMGSTIYKELLKMISDRLAQLIRPLDTVARINEDCFGVLLVPPEGEMDISGNSFKRLVSGLENKSFMTGAGYVQLKCTAAAVVVHDHNEDLIARDLIRSALNLLPEANEAGRLVYKQASDLTIVSDEK